MQGKTCFRVSPDKKKKGLCSIQLSFAKKNIESQQGEGDYIHYVGLNIPVYHLLF